MRELSLHIMDIVENGISAGATLISISIIEDKRKNRMEITIRDNGRGMSENGLQKVLDPFYTSRKTRRVGLGLSLFKEASRRCEGDFHITSKEGEGTLVRADFKLDHIDLAPLGDMAASLTSLIIGNPGVDFVCTHKTDDSTFHLDTREIKTELEDVPITHPDVIRYLTETIREGLNTKVSGL